MVEKIYQFKVTLRGIRPPIWRRFQVASNITFLKFHYIIQTVMGWDNAHLYQFDLGGYYITDSMTIEHVGLDGADSAKTRLDKFVTAEKSKFHYEYDFGDDWDHELLLEKILAAEDGITYPRCIKGKRACPPEDCGGVWGYEELLAAMKDPKHEEREMYLDWLGGEIDPEEFDLETINKELARN